jgi:hypothetical protein
MGISCTKDTQNQVITTESSRLIFCIDININNEVFTQLMIQYIDSYYVLIHNDIRTAINDIYNLSDIIAYKIGHLYRPHTTFNIYLQLITYSRKLILVNKYHISNNTTNVKDYLATMQNDIQYYLCILPTIIHISSTRLSDESIFTISIKPSTKGYTPREYHIWRTAINSKPVYKVQHDDYILVCPTGDITIFLSHFVFYNSFVNYDDQIEAEVGIIGTHTTKITAFGTDLYDELSTAIREKVNMLEREKAGPGRLRSNFAEQN